MGKEENMTDKKYILEARQIEKQYQSGPEILQVLKGIDLRIQQGEILVIMGPSGVGKSTLLHIIGTLDKPSTGQILINGQDTSVLKESEMSRFRNRNIGFVFQFHYLLPEFTALENVLIPRMITDQNWEKDIPHAKELLSEVGISERLNHRPSELSGGEQQRVAVARALINNPKLVLADEPTGNLDSNNSLALFELILNLNQKYRQTFVIVTHNEMFASRANRVIHLLDGEIEREEKIRIQE
jgi:lipoprotein-releasing system ATP-binding protein